MMKGLSLVASYSGGRGVSGRDRRGGNPDQVRLHHQHPKFRPV